MELRKSTADVGSTGVLAGSGVHNGEYNVVAGLQSADDVPEVLFVRDGLLVDSRDHQARSKSLFVSKRSGFDGHDLGTLDIGPRGHFRRKRLYGDAELVLRGVRFVRCALIV